MALYLRVSTNKRQTIANQRRELDALAQRNGWHVVKVFKDKGKRGAKGEKHVDRYLPQQAVDPAEFESPERGQGAGGFEVSPGQERAGWAGHRSPPGRCSG